MTCKCVDLVDEKLAAQNTRIAHVFSIGKEVGMLIGIVTEKVDKTIRGRPLHVHATFCPFCGVKL